MAEALVDALSPRGPGFQPRLVHVTFAADSLALGQVLPRILRFSIVSINSPVLHTDLHLHVAVTRTDGRRSLGNRGGVEWIEKYLSPPPTRPSVNAVTQRADGSKIKLVDGRRGLKFTELWSICVGKHIDKTDFTFTYSLHGAESFLRS